LEKCKFLMLFFLNAVIIYVFRTSKKHISPLKIALPKNIFILEYCLHTVYYVFNYL